MSKAKSALEQKHMQQKADVRTAEIYKAFRDIQDGPNPMTDEEIIKLSKKRPHYAFLAKYAKKG